MDIVGRIGYHPGVRIYVPPPPPPPPAPAAAASRTICRSRRTCNPCTVEIGKTSTVTAVATDSTSCAVTYDVDRARRDVHQRARPADAVDGAEPGRAGAGHRHGDLPDRRQDRERYGQHPGRHGPRSKRVRLRGRALRLRPLQPAAGSDARARRSGAHAAGEPRPARSRSKATPATSARPSTTSRSASAAPPRSATTSTSRGISAERLRTVSYGEERPKYDNAREETRRLNRRAALVVRLTR